MKIDFIIISGVLVVISFLPFILFPILINQERRKLKNKLKEEAFKLNLNISYDLAWNTNRAGIDILKRHLIFVQHLQNNFLIQHVNLNKVYQVKLTSYNKEVIHQERQDQILSRVNLEFFENTSIEPKSVNLFDIDMNYIQDFEIKNAQKLVGELQKYLGAEKLKLTA